MVNTIVGIPMRMIIEAPVLPPAAAWSDDAVAGALFAWFSAAFPTGGFAYSHGLETAAAERRVEGERGLARWLEDILEYGAGWTDAVLLSLAHRSASIRDAAALEDVADLALALAPSRERLAETLGQGEAFLIAVRTGWPDLAFPRLDRAAYPVAAGMAAAAISAAPTTALIAYLTGFTANLIAAGVRLGCCGQGGGVRILSSLSPLITDLASRARSAEESDLGGCALLSDIASMRHETLHTRLFLS